MVDHLSNTIETDRMYVLCKFDLYNRNIFNETVFYTQ